MKLVGVPCLVSNAAFLEAIQALQMAGRRESVSSAELIYFSTSSQSPMYSAGLSDVNILGTANDDRLQALIAHHRAYAPRLALDRPCSIEA